MSMLLKEMMLFIRSIGVSYELYMFVVLLYCRMHCRAPVFST